MKRSKNNNHVQKTENDLAALAKGFREFFPKNQALVIGGEPFTVAKFVGTLEEAQQLYEDAREAHVSLTEKTTARDERHAKVRAIIKNASKFLAGYYGERSMKLLEFGVQPAKEPAELTSEAKAARAAKARATRAARKGGQKPRGGSVT